MPANPVTLALIAANIQDNSAEDITPAELREVAIAIAEDSATARGDNEADPAILALIELNLADNSDEGITPAKLREVAIALAEDAADNTSEGGGSGTSLAPIAETPSGDVDGTNTTFTLENEGYAQIFVGGVYQHPGVDYDQDGTTIEFITAPPDDVAIRAVVFATGSSGGTSGFPYSFPFSFS